MWFIVTQYALAAYLPTPFLRWTKKWNKMVEKFTGELQAEVNGEWSIVGI